MTDRGENRINEDPEQGEGPEIDVEGAAPVSAKTGFERMLAITKDVVQILAIVAAGTFAFFKFVIFDEPSLKKNISVSGELGWLKRPGYCLGELNIEVKNISKSNVEVQEVRGRAWLIDEPSVDQKVISYYDIRSKADEKNAIEPFTIDDGPLVQSYAPGQSSRHTFEWIVKRQANKNVLFLIEAFGPDKTRLLDHQYQWDLVCGENTNEGAKGPD
jgi:hypothetical protein